MAYENEKENYVETFDDGVRKVTDWLLGNLAGIFAFLISMFFLFQGMVKILPTELGIKEQIITAIINIIAGFSITSLVGEYGFTSAKKTRTYNNAMDEYNKSVKSGLKYRDAIDELARERALDNLKNARIHILESANIYYGDVFHENGSLNTNFDITKFSKDNHYRTKLRAYYKAVRMKIVPTNIFGMASSSVFGIKKETTEREYRTKKGAKSLLFKVILGFSSVGIMFVFIGWSWGALIYAFMQIVLWIAIGLIDRQKNYNFVFDETIPQINSKNIIIQEFLEKSEEEKNIYIKKAKERHVEIKQLTYRENVFTNDEK